MTARAVTMDPREPERSRGRSEDGVVSSLMDEDASVSAFIFGGLRCDDEE